LHAKDSIMVGTTSFTSNIALSQKLMGIAKIANPDAVTILGGHHPSVMDVDSARHPSIDVVVRGEGELTVRQLAYEIAKGTRKYRNVSGITFKDGDVVRNPDREEFVDFKDTPLPSFDIIPEEYRNQLLCYVVRSRGCKYNCLFCSESEY